MLNNYPDTLQIDDICEILKVSPNTAYSFLRSHELRGFKCGKNWLIPKESLIEFIKKNTESNSSGA